MATSEDNNWAIDSWCATRRARSPSLSCGMPSCRWVTHPGQLAPGVVSGTSHFGARLRLLDVKAKPFPAQAASMTRSDAGACGPGE
jgi:hypothetical protein